MSDTNDSKPGSPIIVNNPNAPEIYASYVVGAGFDGGNVRLTFVASQGDYSEGRNTVNNTVCVRVVMPVSAAHSMVEFLAQFLATQALNAVQKPPDAPMQ